MYPSTGGRACKNASIRFPTPGYCLGINYPYQSLGRRQNGGDCQKTRLLRQLAVVVSNQGKFTWGVLEYTKGRVKGRHANDIQVVMNINACIRLTSWLYRFRGMLDKARQGKILLVEEIALCFTQDGNSAASVEGSANDDEFVAVGGVTATSSVTDN